MVRVGAAIGARCTPRLGKGGGCCGFASTTSGIAFASILISQGRDVVFVARQLGHASPNITLGVYGHLWEQRAHADRAPVELEAAFGGVLQSKGV